MCHSFYRTRYTQRYNTVIYDSSTPNHLHIYSSPHLSHYNPATTSHFCSPSVYSSSSSVSLSSTLYKKYCTNTPASSSSVPKLPSNQLAFTPMYRQ